MKPNFKAVTQKAPYRVVCLKPSDKDFQKFLALQEVVRAGLADHQKHYLKPRTLQDLKDHMGARMPIIAAYSSSGEYVGHALLTYPVHDDVALYLSHYPFEGMEATTAVIQSFSIAPAHRPSKLKQAWVGKGCDPTSLIFDMAKDLAITHGNTRIMAKVAQDNVRSQEVFGRYGFTLHSQAYDEAGDYQARFLTFPLYGAPRLAAEAQNAVSLREPIPAC